MSTALQPRLNSSKPIRVLIADPEEELQPVYREPLTQAGFDVVTACSGLDCVGRLREYLPDALVLEPHLPWGGGDGVLAMIAEKTIRNLLKSGKLEHYRIGAGRGVIRISEEALDRHLAECEVTVYEARSVVSRQSKRRKLRHINL